MGTIDKLTDTRPMWPTDAENRAQAEAIGATILYHPDLARVGEVAWLLEPGSADSARVGRESPIFRTPQGRVTGPLNVAHVSEREPLELHGLGHRGVRLIAAGRRMEVLIDGARCSGSVELGAAELERGVIVVLGRAVALMVHTVDMTADTTADMGLIGASRAMRKLRAEIRRVADQNVPVLLRGETGVGKELVACAIHGHSARSSGPYVPVNVAAIPSSMAEAELFGYVRGAFTGATQARLGHFALAHGGTLFLDEVGEAPPDIQAKLLRITEHQELQPLGGKPQSIDVRLLAATDSELEQAVESGRFRRPLLERLSGYPIRVPPLRDRRDDIPRLFVHFLRSELARLGQADKLAAPVAQGRPWLPLRLMLDLIEYPWPGNVRELFNTAVQLAIANRDADGFRRTDAIAERLGSRRMQPGGSPCAARGDAAGRPSAAPRRQPSEITDQEIAVTLERNGFNLSRTAAEFDMSRSTLHVRIESSTLLRKAADLERAEIVDALAKAGGDIGDAAAVLRVSERALVLRMGRLGVARIGPR